MKLRIYLAVLLSAATLVAAPAAKAHGVSVSRFDAPRHYHEYVFRVEAMPYWLKRNKEFRRWYKRSGLRRVRRLAWWQVYEIYVYERRSHVRYSRRFDRDDYGRNYYRGRNDFDNSTRRRKRDRG